MSLTVFPTAKMSHFNSFGNGLTSLKSVKSEQHSKIMTKLAMQSNIQL